MSNNKKNILLRKRTILISILVIVITARIMLPSIVKNYVNKELASLDGYTGKIDDIDIALYRGAYVIKDFTLFSDDFKNVPLVKLSKVDLSVQWKSIFNGSFVGEADIYDLAVNFTTGIENNTEKNNFKDVEKAGWQEVVNDLFPLKFNRLALHNSEIHYKDLTASPKIDLMLTELNGEAKNLTNSTKLSKSKVADVNINGVVMNDAKLNLATSLDPFDTNLTFDGNIKMEALSIPKLNNYLKHYAKVDAEKGTISLFGQIDVKNGNSNGYIKPLVKDIKLLSIKGADANDSFIEKVREGAANLASKVLDNNKKDQLGSKIVFEGDINDPDIKILKSISTFLSNAFIKAIEPGLEPKLLSKK